MNVNKFLIKINSYGRQSGYKALKIQLAEAVNKGNVAAYNHQYGRVQYKINILMN